MLNPVNAVLQLQFDQVMSTKSPLRILSSITFPSLSARLICDYRDDIIGWCQGVVVQDHSRTAETLTSQKLFDKHMLRVLRTHEVDVTSFTSTQGRRSAGNGVSIPSTALFSRSVRRRLCLSMLLDLRLELGVKDSWIHGNARLIRMVRMPVTTSPVV
jgi:hypothetical protein